MRSFFVSRERFRDALCLGISSWHSCISDTVPPILTNFIAVTYLSHARLKMDFFDNGYFVVDLLDPQFAINAWNEIQGEEMTKVQTNTENTPFTQLPLPETPHFTAFRDQVDKVGNGSVRTVS